MVREDFDGLWAGMEVTFELLESQDQCEGFFFNGGVVELVFFLAWRSGKRQGGECRLEGQLVVVQLLYPLR